MEVRCEKNKNNSDNQVIALKPFIFIGIILSTSQKYFTMRQEELGKLNSHIEQIYSGLLVVKTYNGKNDSDKKFDKYNESVRVANQKSQFLSGLMPPVMQFIGNFGYVAVCISGALLVKNGAITFGTIVAFITYVRLFTSPLSRIAQSASSLQSAAAASERVFEFIDETELTPDSTYEIKIKKDSIKGDIEFSHINFSYDGKPVIHDFSAEAKAGQKVAIVGPTGAGKTTLIRCINRIILPDEGNILFDGRPITQKDVYRIGYLIVALGGGVNSVCSNLFGFGVSEIYGLIRFGHIVFTVELCGNIHEFHISREVREDLRDAQGRSRREENSKVRMQHRSRKT